MLNKTLVDYVRAARSARIQEYFIRQALIDAGWDRTEIDDVLDSEAAWPPESRIDFPSAIRDGVQKTINSAAPIKKRYKFSVLRTALFVVPILLVAITIWTFTYSLSLPHEIILPTADQTDLSFKFGGWPALENTDFFKQVKSRFIEAGTNFIESDLSEMKLRIYVNGVVKKEVPILSKGREGSWWETPAGLYQVQSKTPNHLSSLGHVYMPWSMAFQGNFFIHGWPYYPSGEPVTAGYSGGCIRLSTEDAKIIYDLVEINTPVLVFERGFEKDGFEYKVLDNQMTSKSFLGADLKNNFVFAESNSTTSLPIASLTKLMTAVVATEYINVERTTTITSGALVSTSKPRLQIGQEVTVLDLLYPLLAESSNEAGVAIANILGTERFVALMNEKAKSIGMENTHFTDPAGSSQENVSTAQDLFQLAKYLYNNRAFVLMISRGDVETTTYSPPPWNDLKNFNIFSEDPEFIGGKVGKSNAASETVLSIFEIESNGTNRPVVVVVLGAENGNNDATNLIQFIRSAY